MGWQPDYIAEARLYGLDIKKNHPNAKIAILYQNDSYGKDYQYGFKSALGKALADKLIVGEQAYRRPRRRHARLAARAAQGHRGGHVDDLRHADPDDPVVRDHAGAQLEAGQHLRQLGLGDRHLHGCCGPEARVPRR